MKKSFLGASDPFLLALVQARTKEKVIESIRASIADGATAIGVQIEQLEFEYRTAEIFTEIFACAGELPIYITNYRDQLNLGRTPESRVEELKTALRCGGTLVDIMGDLYAPSENQLTNDSVAIERQKRLIDDIHGAGGEVLISSHIKKFLPCDEVLKMALEQERRGADIVKIVTAAYTEQEEIENLETCRILNKELKVPFVFLSTGTHYKIHRTVAPLLGAFAWLCVHKHDELSTPAQPLLSDLHGIKRYFDINKENKNESNCNQ